MIRIRTLKIWTILFICAIGLGLASCSDSSTGPDKSSAKLIVSFKIEGVTPIAVGAIDNNAKTVKVMLPSTVDKTSLIPTITVSDKATISPESGAVQNFTSPVAYTVTAEDGSKAVYTVSIVDDTSSTAALTLTGSMNENRTLKDRNSGIDYIIDGPLYIEGNALLTIEPGVKIAFTGVNSSLTIEENAGIKITGTANNPVIFTGPVNNQNKGAWGGISLRSNRSDNVWDYVQILNAGQEDRAALELGSDSRLTLRNCLISGSLGRGIELASSAKFNEFKSNVIENCDQGPILFDDISQIAPLDLTSTLKNNPVPFIDFKYNSTTVAKELTINKLDVAFRLASVYVEANLNIQPGVTMIFQSGSSFVVRDGAILKAEGTSDSKITFTGITKEAGFWNGVFIQSTLSNSMKYCVIEYGGKDEDTNLDITGAKLSIFDCIIRNSLKYGATINSDTKVSHGSVVFDNCPGGNVYNRDDDTVSDKLP